MGLITLTGVIAAEVTGSSVTANVVLPSIIDTPANREAMPKADPRKRCVYPHLRCSLGFRFSIGALGL